MSREDVQDLLAMIQATYPNYNPQSKSAAVNAWHMALEEYSKDLVAVAFKSYIKTDTSGFAPSPGQIIDRIHKITTPGLMNEAEAWALVRRALSNSGYNATKEFAKLPPTVQRAVGLPGQLREWALTDDLNHEVVMASFQRNYRAEIQREMELQKMPQMVRDMVDAVNIGSYLGQIEQERQRAMESLTGRKEDEIKALEEHKDAVPMPEGYIDRLIKSWGIKGSKERGEENG